MLDIGAELKNACLECRGIQHSAGCQGWTPASRWELASSGWWVSRGFVLCWLHLPNTRMLQLLPLQCLTACG